MARQKKHKLVIHEYSRLAPDYDARWYSYVHNSARETINRVALTDGDRILDTGCGSGVLLDYLSHDPQAAKLTGIDLSADMLKLAKARLNAATGIYQACAEQLPFANCQFDIVISNNVLHFLREPLKALHEASRVLRPAGRIIITDWCRDYLTCQAMDIYLRLFNKAHFKTYNTEDCVALLHAAGFGNIRIERYKINWLWGLMTATAEKPPSEESDNHLSGPGQSQ